MSAPVAKNSKSPWLRIKRASPGQLKNCPVGDGLRAIVGSLSDGDEFTPIPTPAPAEGSIAGEGVLLIKGADMLAALFVPLAA